VGCHQRVSGVRFEVSGWEGEGIRVEISVEAETGLGESEAGLHPVEERRKRRIVKSRRLKVISMTFNF
jgi:hypothetical protein